MYCHNCQKQVPDNVELCPYCNATISSKSEPDNNNHAKGRFLHSKKVLFIAAASFIVLISLVFYTFYRTPYSVKYASKPSAPISDIEENLRDTLSKTAITNSEEYLVPETLAVADEVEPTIDMSGDYIGSTVCPNPPKDSSYTIYNNEDSNECIALYITNIDNSNIKFHLTKATQNASTGQYTENVIFKEHIAHYNGSEYEYIGTNYHLYFQYYVQQPAHGVVSDHRVVVYGLDNLFNRSQYASVTDDNGSSGSMFVMNLPFAG